MGKPVWAWVLFRALAQRFPSVVDWTHGKRRLRRSELSGRSRLLRTESLGQRVLLAGDVTIATTPDDSVISVVADSAGQITTPIAGEFDTDVNQDGTTTAADALLIVNAMEDPVTAQQFPRTDFNQDEAINSDDLFLALVLQPDLICG